MDGELVLDIKTVPNVVFLWIYMHHTSLLLLFHSVTKHPPVIVVVEDMMHVIREQEEVRGSSE